MPYLRDKDIRIVESGETIEEFIARADKLMFKAKDLGRNRVVSE